MHKLNDWNISEIVAGSMSGFNVDNDFEADTSGGGTVEASCRFIQVKYLFQE